MLTTTEEKLSAIKAINEELATLEESISKCVHVQTAKNSFVALIFDKAKGPVSFWVPHFDYRINCIDHGKILHRSQRGIDHQGF